MKPKPLLEKYMTYLRTSEEMARARIKRNVRLDSKGRDYNLAILSVYTSTYVHMAESSQKYRLAKSGLAMVETLRPRPLLRDEPTLGTLEAIASHARSLDPDIDTPVAQLPGAAIWIELEQPIETNTGEIAAFFFTCSGHETEYQLSLPQTRLARTVLEQTLHQLQTRNAYRWSLHFINAEGSPKSHYEYHELEQDWSILPGGKPCPTGECVTEETKYADGVIYRDIRACPFCAVMLAQWRSWFTTALLTVSGEFAESEEREWPIVTESVTRKVPRPHSPKYDEISVHHEYYLVAFDACIKQQGRPTPPDEVVRRSSWVEQAREIDPEAIVYMRRGFGATERLLDPSRIPQSALESVKDGASAWT